MEENKGRWGIWSKMLWNTNLRKEHGKKMLGFKVQRSFKRFQTLKDHGNALNSFVLTTPTLSLTTTWTTHCYSYNYTTLFSLSSLCFSSLQNSPPNYVSSWCCFSFLGVYYFSRLSWLMDSLQKIYRLQLKQNINL